MIKIGLFFGPQNGAVHRVACKIVKKLGDDVVELVHVENAKAIDAQKYDKIIFGISTVGKETWDSEYANTDWAKFFSEVKKIDFNDKTIAIYGLGDSITYADHFVDAMGKLYKEIKSVCPNANIVGRVGTADYDFNNSEAVVDGEFVGIPLDEDFESELTDKRLDAWLKVIAKDFGL